MSKDITDGLLRKAGFKEVDGNFEYGTQVNGFTRIISVIHDSSLYGYNYAVCVSLGNNEPIAFAYIQTVDHFDKLMEIVDIDFRLEEE